jgi:hypothetical protein
MFQTGVRSWARTAPLGGDHESSQVHGLLQDSLYPFHLSHGRNIVGQNLHRLLPTATVYAGELQPLPVRCDDLHSSDDYRLCRDFDFSMYSCQSRMGFDTATSAIRYWKCEMLQFDYLPQPWSNEQL